jgi:hypothetical protein
MILQERLKLLKDERVFNLSKPDGYVNDMIQLLPSKKSHHVFMTKTNRLVLCRELTAGVTT